MIRVFYVNSYKHLSGLLIAVIISILLTSCALSENSAKEKAPKWVYGFVASDGTCGVGVSKPHMRGYSYQRATAISRAIDEIARQKNVKVSTSLETIMKKSGGTASSDMMSYSVQTTDGETVSSQIIDMWKNDRTDEFFVKMCST